MQVSEAAAVDVGGGDRFDPMENRALGRAYLAQLYRRYKNWPDAVAAYNWGASNVDGWVKAGRPNTRLLVSVAAYTSRVLRDSGLCDSIKTKTRASQRSALVNSVDRLDAVGTSPMQSTCTYPDSFDGASRRKDRRTDNSADNGRTAGQVLSRFEQEVQAARSSWNLTVHYSSECGPSPGNYRYCKY
jgi:hypothetical protein